MSWHLVAGVPLPDAVGGHPALDLCNTRAGWGSPEPKEYLTAPVALALWAVDAGLLPGAPAPEQVAERVAAVPARSAGADLRRALALRAALYRCALGGGAPGDWQVVSREAAGARTGWRLHPGPDGARWHPPGPDADPVRVALQAAAACAAGLLAAPPAHGVAACPGHGCGWLFADPRGRRRWCSMAVCGNRAKARRHAGRRVNDVTPGATAG